MNTFIIALLVGVLALIIGVIIGGIGITYGYVMAGMLKTRNRITKVNKEEQQRKNEEEWEFERMHELQRETTE